MDARILSVLNGLGYKTVKEDYYGHIEEWEAWYSGPVEAFHKYKIWNGTKFVHQTKMTAGMAKKVAEDWADLCMSEKVAITIDGKKEQAFWDEVCKETNFRIMANRFEELAFALGTTAIVARVADLTVSKDGTVLDGGKIKFDYITARNIFPLSWENGIVTECAFASYKYSKGVPYVYLQIHKLAEDDTYDIENRLYNAEGGSLVSVPTQSIPAFETVPDVFHTGLSEPLFVLNSPNIANSIDVTCPLGMSVYANALDQLKTVDNTFDSFNNEIILGRKRVAVQADMLGNIKGEPTFDSNDVIFYFLPQDAENGTMIKDLSSDMRIEDLYKAVQVALNALSMKCGLGANRWNFDQGSITTATQVMSANSDAFRTLKKHELVLDGVIKSLVRIVLTLGNAFLNAGLNADAEVTVDFDDSIIEDTASEFDRDCRLLQLGVISRAELRSWYKDESLEDAEKNLPDIIDLTEQTEPEEE